MRPDRANGATQLVPQEELVEPRGPMRPLSLEQFLSWPVEMVRLRLFVGIPMTMIEFVVNGPLRMYKQYWNAPLLPTEPAAG